MYISASAECKWDHFRGRDRRVGIGQFRDFLLIGVVHLFTNASGSRIVDLSLNVVNKPGLVGAVKFIHDRVTTETSQGAIRDSVVTSDFTLVEVIPLRNNTEVRAGVAANVILHTAHG